MYKRLDCSRELPPELIARYPVHSRVAARMLFLDGVCFSGLRREPPLTSPVRAACKADSETLLRRISTRLPRFLVYEGV